MKTRFLIVTVLFAAAVMCMPISVSMAYSTSSNATHEYKMTSDEFWSDVIDFFVMLTAIIVFIIFMAIGLAGGRVGVGTTTATYIALNSA